MNFKAYTLEGQRSILWGLVEALKSGKLHFWKWNLLRCKCRRWAYSIFYLVLFRPWDPTKTIDFGRRRGIVLRNDKYLNLGLNLFHSPSIVCFLKGYLSLLWGVVEALKSGKLHVWKWKLFSRRKRRRCAYSIFSFGTLQALGSRPNPRSFEEDAAFF